MAIRGWLLTMLAFVGMALAAHAAAPAAPTNCVAAGIGYSAGGASIRINWTDSSTNETQWIVQININNGGFQNLSSFASGSTASTGTTLSVLWSSGVANTAYRFRVWAVNGSELSVSNETSVTPTVFTLTASAVQCQAAIALSWPNVSNVSGYKIWIAPQGAPSYSLLDVVPANVTSYQVIFNASEANKKYFFVVQPYIGIETNVIGDSNQASAIVDIPATMTSKTGTSGTPGSAFSHTFTHVSVATVSTRTLTGAPAGLSFNSSTGALSGVYPALGNYTLTYAVKFTTGSTLTQTFHIRVRPPAGPPAVGTPIPAWNGVAGASRDTVLAGTFTDAEAESAVRVSTTLGDMDFILFNTATPATVTNFMNYVGTGKYTDVAFHRSASDYFQGVLGPFVIQSGGFKGTGKDSNFTSVVPNPNEPGITNEPGIANVRGTLSMAKKGGDPNSATSQFFVSLNDNRANLDYQNGGFTVFGRVAGNGMTVADAIYALPTGTYNLLLDDSDTATSFPNFPMNAASAPAAMDQTKLVKVNSVTTIPTLSYRITGNTNSAVAAASIVNGQLHLVGLAGGQTTITVAATDLDNLTTSQTVAVNLTDTYAAWAARNPFPGGQNGLGQNPDGDGWNNLLEYAFFGNPALSDPMSQVVFPGTTGTAPAARYMTLTFPLRKFTQGLTYAVQANDGLSGAWTEIWQSTSGLAHPQVVSAVVQADRTVVTIKDTAALGGRAKHFLRTRIVQE